MREHTQFHAHMYTKLASEQYLMHELGIGAVGLVAPRPDSEESVKDFIERHLGSAVSMP